jgi:hypothetical protein
MASERLEHIACCLMLMQSMLPLAEFSGFASIAARQGNPIKYPPESELGTELLISITILREDSAFKSEQ